MQPAHILLSQAGLFKCHMAAKQFWVNARGLAKSATRHPTAFANCHKSPKHGPNIKKACLQMPQCPQIFFGKCKRAFSKCHLAAKQFWYTQKGPFQKCHECLFNSATRPNCPQQPLGKCKTAPSKVPRGPPSMAQGLKTLFSKCKKACCKSATRPNRHKI